MTSVRTSSVVPKKFKLNQDFNFTVTEIHIESDDEMLATKF